MKTKPNNFKNSKLYKNVLKYSKNNSVKLKIIFLILVCAFMIIKGIMQQPEILENKEEIVRLEQEIEYEKSRQKEVEKMRDNIETDEYIEQIARDKLGMMKQNEKVFIDASASE